MSAILRPTDRRAAQSGVAFHWDDMTARATEYLEKVRAEASRIVAEAHRQAERVRQEAEEAGRRAGRQAIEDAVSRQLAGKLQTLMPALRQMVADLQQAEEVWLAHWEKAGLRVAVAIAERLVRRQLSETPQIASTLLREALELAAGSASLRIHLNPADLETLKSQLGRFARELAPAASTDWVPDPEITRGGCRVETQFGEIDQRWETQLRRIQEELT